MDCFVAALLAMTSLQHSRGAISPEFFKISSAPENQRAQGMPGARRARGPGPENKAHRERSTTVTSELPDIPRAMVLRLLRALPGDQALLTPSPADRSPPA